MSEIENLTATSRRKKVSMYLYSHQQTHNVTDEKGTPLNMTQTAFAVIGLTKCLRVLTGVGFSCDVLFDILGYWSHSYWLDNIGRQNCVGISIDVLIIGYKPVLGCTKRS